MMSVSFDLHISRVAEMYPDTVELLANDGKITANRAFLRLASSAIHKQLTENPDVTIFDMKNHKKTTIDCLLRGIYNGKATCTDEVEKEEVMSLAQELDINITQTLTTSIQTELAGEASKVLEEPEEQPKNVDPQLTRLKDGRVSCDICFKTFSSKSGQAQAMGIAKKHYKQIHLASKDKNIDCRFQGCLKKFKCLDYMKIHMLQRHGISAKQIPSTTKTKSSTSYTKLAKKGIKKEPPKEVIEEEQESQSIED